MLCILLCDISQQLHHAYILVKLWFLWGVHVLKKLNVQVVFPRFLCLKENKSTVTTAIIECNHLCIYLMH